MSIFHPSRTSRLALPLAALVLAGGVMPMSAQHSLSAATAPAVTLVNLTDPVSGRSIQVRLADHRVIVPQAGHAQVAQRSSHPPASCPITRGCVAHAPAPVIE